MAEESEQEKVPPPDTPAPTQRQAFTEDDLIDAVDESGLPFQVKIYELIIRQGSTKKKKIGGRY